MSASAGWYPDPGGGPGLYRYWDGQAWSAATTGNPASPPPSAGLGSPAPTGGAAGSGQGSYGQGSYGQGSYGQGAYGGSSTFGGGRGEAGQSGRPGQPAQLGGAGYQQLTTRRRSGLGWWIGAGALLLVIVVIAVFAIRTATSTDSTGTSGSGQGSSTTCPSQVSESADPATPAADGRVHGGPVSYPQLGSPWSPPTTENRVPFGVDVHTQNVVVEPNYDKDSNWVASVLVGELQAGDGFFTPEQGSQIVVKCILGAFYGNNKVNSDVIQDAATTVDGHDAWIVESKLTFDIPNLQTKGERLIVVIVQAGTSRSGLFYASIPDTTPQLLQPARDALKQLTVDG